MPDLSTASIVLVVVASLFTAAAAVWDMRQRRIPNKLTLPVFFAGWVYQAVFHWPAGLQDAGLGFLVGFGVLFILWIVGGGGGGDVKLMGALSVWLGFQLTLLVMIVSTCLVVVTAGGAVLWSLIASGFEKSVNKYLLTKKPGQKKAPPETVAHRQGRRIMAYAVPVAMATWIVLIWKLPTLP